jgi:histidinol dehydrogenase
MKHSSIISYSAGALNDVSQAVQTLAEAEGLPSHGYSVKVRGDRPSSDI